MSLDSAEEFALAPTVEASLAMIESLGAKFESRDRQQFAPRQCAFDGSGTHGVPDFYINLVGNAIKFTPAGGTVCLTGRALAHGGYEVTVQDSGIGMNAEEIAQP